MCRQLPSADSYALPTWKKKKVGHVKLRTSCRGRGQAITDSSEVLLVKLAGSGVGCCWKAATWQQHHLIGLSTQWLCVHTANR